MFNKDLRMEIARLEYEIKRMQKILSHNGIYCSGENSPYWEHIDPCPDTLTDANKKIDLIMKYLHVFKQVTPEKEELVKEK